MEIAIFKDLTTNEYLDELKVESEKYTGLYVDMDNAPERKYVKDKAYDIQQLLKKIDRKRIDAAKEYKLEVEKEASEIIDKLKEANEPFTLLIDAYAAERKKILDAEKARKQLILDAEKLELDHEMGLLINKTYEFDRAEELRIAVEEKERVEAEALKLAVDRLAALGKAQEQDKINEKNARLADKEYKGRVNRLALLDLVNSCGITEEQAKSVIIAITKKEITQVTINY